MSKLPATKQPQALAKTASRPVRVAEPARAGAPFFSFRYSFTEVSAVGGKTIVKSRHTRLENGRLTQESFEGEMQGDAFEPLAAQAQRHALAQAALMWRAFTGFLPAPWRKSDRD
jgi:hypothetical protein